MAGIRNINAARVTAAAMGILVGLSGVEHGIFEILQGNIPTGGMEIDAIGPAQKLWENASESALTLLPTFLLTGICALTVGLLIILWSVGFIHKKGGGLVLILLAAIQLYAGGGIAVTPIAILAGLAAFCINRPLKLWRRLPAGVHRVLAAVWPVLLIAFAVLFPGMLVIAIVGLGFLEPDSTTNLLWIMGFSSLGLMALAVPTGLSYDVRRQGELTQKSSAG